jgi:hypothetical protein
VVRPRAGFPRFGGAGTTYMAAELKARRWLGIEIGPTDDIVQRFADIEQDRKILADQRKELNALFTPKVRVARERTGWWTCESVRVADDEKRQRALNLGGFVSELPAKEPDRVPSPNRKRD